MGVKWTAEQQKVIDLRNRNILVSAAAGSGKTAVLVERIIQMLMDEVHPVDVDKLLIVTFTEAAAAEMKDRIREAIEKVLEEQPDNVHLQRQSALIYSAQVTTIHSFCLSVIRNHFHVLDIDPGFRTAEEGELKLLKQDVLDELLEARYTEGECKFLEFTEKFGTGRSDKKIEEIILTLYEYSRSYPQPERWLDSCAAGYLLDGEKPEESECFVRVKELVHFRTEDMLCILKEARRLCAQSDGPYMYEDALSADKERIEQLQKAGTLSEMYECVQNMAWKTLSSKKDDTVDKQKREQAKKLREQVKTVMKELKESFFYEEPVEIIQDMRDSAAVMEVLTGLVKEFAALFTEKKQNRNLIDFSDMEHYALKILTAEKDGELLPSDVAAEYQNRFVEVMIDEYQDSNLIQEAILTSVSRTSLGEHNIFMVGDVKQSIYRFRLSRPELFMEKYETYSQTDGECQRIDLHKNFRSRTEVLASVNFIFEQIMRKELGGIRYDEQAALYPGAAYEPQVDAAGRSINRAELLLVDASEEEEDEGTGGTQITGRTANARSEENMSGGAQVIAGSSSGKAPHRVTARELEGRAVACRIKALLKEGRVLDKETGEYRAPRCKDIVILTRSMRGWSDVLTKVLLEEGIPAYAGSMEGYFETYEVSVLLDYLRILDNYRQELPLTAVLTSPFVGLSAAELSEIRICFPGVPFYEAVRAYTDMPCCRVEAAEVRKNEPSRNLQARLRDFLTQYEQFRGRVPYTAIHELLQHVVEDTGYGFYIAAMPGGAQRIANVEMLVEKAKAFEGTSYKGLFNFVRYIEQLQKYEVDYGEASLEDEQSDTVRIMSIHKSKGLEFPIVFVVGFGKRFNMQDVTGSLVIHPEWGVGIDAIDLNRRTKIPTILKKVIQEEIKRENLGEELRVLYVALTRAKEKLIMVGTLVNAGEKLEELMEEGAAVQSGTRVCGQEDKRLAAETSVDFAEKEDLAREPLPEYVLLSARSYKDWILPLLPRLHPDTPLDVSVISRSELEDLEMVSQQAEVLARDTLEHWDTEKIYDARMREKLSEQLSYAYPYEGDKRLKLKFTVSELKKRAYLEEESGEMLYGEPDVIPLLPEFLKEETTLTGALRGTVYHKLLELLDFTKEYEADSLCAEIKRFTELGNLTKEASDCIRIEDILHFLHCESGQRMHRAAISGMLKKEQPFVLGVDVSEIYPEEQSGETILVQGIIDVCFEEDGELVVLDYKTDRVKTAAELVEKYHAQLEYYAQALEQLLQKKVKEKIIYSFTLQQEIPV